MSRQRRALFYAALAGSTVPRVWAFRQALQSVLSGLPGPRRLAAIESPSSRHRVAIKSPSSRHQAAIRRSSKIATARVHPAEAPRILCGKQLMKKPSAGTDSRLCSFSMWQ